MGHIDTPIEGTTLFDGGQTMKGYALNNYHIPISNTAAATVLMEPA